MIASLLAFDNWSIWEIVNFHCRCTLFLLVHRRRVLFGLYSLLFKRKYHARHTMALIRLRTCILSLGKLSVKGFCTVVGLLWLCKLADWGIHHFFFFFFSEQSEKIPVVRLPDRRVSSLWLCCAFSLFLPLESRSVYCIAGNFCQEFNFAAFVKPIFWLN